MHDYGSFRRTHFFASLNAIRCLSIVMVVWHHTMFITDSTKFPMLYRGNLGVDIFFVISGFIIVTLILREKTDKGDFNLKNFYVRRFLRIFPVYYLILLICFVFLIVMPSWKEKNKILTEMPYLLTYTSNWFQQTSFMMIAWSLATEEQFYLCWPPIERFFKTKIILSLLFIFLLFNQFVNFGGLYLILPDYSNYLMKLEILRCTFTPICLGVLLAHVLHSEKYFNKFSKLFGYKYSPIIVLLMFIVLFNIPGKTNGMIRMLIQVFACLLIGTFVINENNFFVKLTRLKLLQRIGIVSYGIYLYHMFFIMLIHRYLGDNYPYTFFISVLGITYLVSELSYLWFEEPILAFRKYFY